MSRRCFIGLAGSAVAARLLSLGDAGSNTEAPLRELEVSTWVWRPELTPTLVETAASVGVTRLLLWAPPNLSSDSQGLQGWSRLARSAAAAGMTVSALGGDPHWALAPRLARSWAEELASLDLVDRLHLDVEPDALGLSGTPADAAYNGLLSCLTESKSTGLPVDADVPAHYAGRRSGGDSSFLTRVLEVADEVTIMAYRSRAGDVLSAAEQSLQQVKAMNRRAWVGVNLRDPGGDAPSTVLTYRGGDARAEVAALTYSARSRGEIAGIALHDARALTLLQEE